MMRLLFGAIVFIGVCHATQISAAVVYRTVALSGQAAPGGAGEIFSSFTGTFSGPLLNANGHTAFMAKFSTGVAGVTANNDSALWSEGSGTLALVAREGSQAPATPAGARFTEDFLGIRFNDAGQILFKGTLATGSGGVTSLNNEGLWTGISSDLSLLAREGSQAPGAPPGANFGPLQAPHINNAGEIAFTAGLAQGSGGVTANNNEGVWALRDGSISLVAREGAQAPGLPPGTLFGGNNLDLRSFSYAQLDAAGHITFSAYMGGELGLNNTGIWTDRGGTLELIVRGGDQAPGTPSGTHFLLFSSAPEVNRFGQVAAQLNLTGPAVTADNRIGVFAERSGPLELIARSGNPAPGTLPGINFGILGGPSFNDSGKSAFFGNLVGNNPELTTQNNEGMWSEGFGTTSLVAREGDQAPDTPAVALFQSFNMFAYRPILNNAGQIAFPGKLRQGAGGVTPDNDGAMWAQDRNGRLRLVVREGDPFTVAPGDTRIIGTIGPDGDARPFSFNDDGTLAFVLNFTDGSQGVFTVTLLVPEPAASLMLLMGMMAIFLRRSGNVS